MAPPETTFPLHELEDRIHLKTVNFKEKSRKLSKDFDLKRDCELFELVQYSCTTPKEMEHKALFGGSGRMECYPFVRLFRRCGEGDRMFHVETTAWEGRHAYKYPKRILDETIETRQLKQIGIEETSTNWNYSSMFANYGSYFWSGK